MDLQAIKDAADQRYQPFPVKMSAQKTVNLVNPTKLPDETRKAAMDALQVADDDEHIRERLEAVIIMIAEKPTDGRALVKALGGNLAYLTETVRQWSEAVKAGEALPSVS